ncbi:MAG TPA: OmpH family outer membrane protein [Agriterribacter sp.]|nr:OmpH family outer membrane protein [Chitinophagaceae bacterium]HRP33872.1 OmpH family outer membrane protein [Agriterribacter sp.]
MKKIFSFFAITTTLLIVSNKADAQQKLGHASLEDIVSIMPDIRKADSLLQKFRKDSLENTLPFYVSEYKRKDSIAKAPTTPAAIKQTVQQEANNYLSIIQNWDQFTQNEMQRKQQEVLNPYFAKAFELINTVAKENGYTWVFKQDALLVAPQTDDLLPLVAKKLGVKLPTGAAGLNEPAKPAAGAKKQ